MGPQCSTPPFARLLAMLANLAARKNAPAGTAERLLKYVDAGIAAADKDDLRWQAVKYQLLVALDRPKDLEQALREWIAADGPVNRWRLSLGYLLAEQGKLAEAIELFEAVAAADELGPAEYRTLADWYMAVEPPRRLRACDDRRLQDDRRNGG